MTISLFNAEKLRYGRNFQITIGRKAYKGVLFEDCRLTEIYRKSAHVYGMRHPDDDMCVPASISTGYPLVNFFGSFVTKKPIPLTAETTISSWQELS